MKVTRVFFSTVPQVQEALQRGPVFACGQNGLLFLRITENMPSIGVCGIVQDIFGSHGEQQALMQHALKWKEAEGLAMLLMTFWNTESLKAFRLAVHMDVDPIGAVCAIKLPQEVVSHVQPNRGQAGVDGAGAGSAETQTVNVQPVVDVRSASEPTEQAVAGQGADGGMAGQDDVADGFRISAEERIGKQYNPPSAKPARRKKVSRVGRSVEVFPDKPRLPPDSFEASSPDFARGERDPLRF